MICSAVELFRATAWHTVPDLVSGPAPGARARSGGRATGDVGADRGDGAEGAGAGARPGPGAQEVEEGQAMRLFEKLRRMIVENRRGRMSIEARRAHRCRRSMR